MRFAPDNQIKSKEKMIEFLCGERVGRFATIDKNGGADPSRIRTPANIHFGGVMNND